MNDNKRTNNNLFALNELDKWTKRRDNWFKCFSFLNVVFANIERVASYAYKKFHRFADKIPGFIQKPDEHASGENSSKEGVSVLFTK